MYHIKKSLADIQEADLLTLIEQEVGEGRNIEYKREIYGSDDKGKYELKKDVTSLANSGGGDLIIGIEEEGGIPRNITGVDVDTDKEIARIENILHSGIEPRLPNIGSIGCKLKSGKSVLIIRVGNSWIKPHGIKANEHYKFFGRTSNGVYSYDWQQIRSAFLIAEGALDKIRSFHKERLFAISSGDAPLILQDGALLIIHLIPINAFDLESEYPVLELKRNHADLAPLDSSGYSNQITIDGIVKYSRYSDSENVNTYTQFSKNGVLEIVNRSLFANLLNPEEKYIPSLPLEREVIKGITHYISLYEKFQVIPPIFLFFSLIGVKGYRMSIPNEYSNFNRAPRSLKDIVQCSPQSIGDYKIPAQTVLRPIFDQLWNAFGYEKSPYYDNQGNWKPR